MIDLHRLRTDPVGVAALLKKKDPSFAVDTLIALDQEVRDLQVEVDDLRHEKNDLAQQGKAGVTDELREKAKLVGMALKAKDAELQEKQNVFKKLYLHCPNIILDSVPEGTAEQNRVVKTWGTKPEFSFNPKHHVELGQINGWFDFEAAAKMAGSNFVMYTGEGALVVYKLMLYMLMHNTKQGFSCVLPPFLVNQKTLQGAGNFPRFADEIYAINDEDLYLTPTSEVNLTAIYRDHIFMVDELPKRITAWTSCFRREAGGYGATERGLIRLHQFNKAEIYTLCTPEKAEREQDYMLATAEAMLQALGLHYQIVLLAAQDCSFSSAKTFDIEVWMPGQGVYKEISSVSNCTDFQARRSSIRFKETQAEKPQLVSTLNGSSLALPRLLVALMETYQQPDGSIALPALLDRVTIGS